MAASLPSVGHLRYEAVREEVSMREKSWRVQCSNRLAVLDVITSKRLLFWPLLQAGKTSVLRQRPLLVGNSVQADQCLTNKNGRHWLAPKPEALVYKGGEI